MDSILKLSGAEPYEMMAWFVMVCTKNHATLWFQWFSVPSVQQSSLRFTSKASLKIYFQSFTNCFALCVSLLMWPVPSVFGVSSEYLRRSQLGGLLCTSQPAGRRTSTLIPPVLQARQTLCCCLGIDINWPFQSHPSSNVLAPLCFLSCWCKAHWKIIRSHPAFRMLLGQLLLTCFINNR